MSLNWPKSHHGFVPEYQVSSWPYLTSSTLQAGETREIRFPGVTRWIELHNNDHGSGNHILNFGMTQNCFLPANSNYYSLHPGEQTNRLELKCVKLFLSSSSETPFSIIAGYTNISTGSFPVLTGSNGWEGVG